MEPQLIKDQLKDIQKNEPFARSPGRFDHLKWLVEYWLDLQELEDPPNLIELDAIYRERSSLQTKGSIRTTFDWVKQSLKEYYAAHSLAFTIQIEGGPRHGGYRLSFPPHRSDNVAISPGNRSAQSALQIIPLWDTPELYELMSGLKQGATLRIQTTYILNPRNIYPIVKKALQRGVSIRILLLDPDFDPLLQARFRLRTDDETATSDMADPRDESTPEEVRINLRRQLSVLARLEGKYSNDLLQVRITDVMPFGLFVQSKNSGDRDWMRVGFMPATASFLQGPMVRVAPEEKAVWRVFEAAWEAAWMQPIDPARGRYFVKVFEHYPEERIREEVEFCQRFRLVITGFPDMRLGSLAWYETLKKALTQNSAAPARIEILLWDPNCPFVKSRGRAIDQHGRKDNYVSTLIEENRMELRKLRESTDFSGELEVRTATGPTAANCFWVDDQIYFGLYWNDRNAIHGPHFLADARTGIGKVLADQCDRLWERATPDDLSHHAKPDTAETRINGYDDNTFPDSDAAMQYVTKQLPRARLVLNTHARMDRTFLYDQEETTGPLTVALNAFLSRKGSAAWTDVIGKHVEQDYIKRVYDGVTGTPKEANFLIYRLDEEFPLMNFLILKYSDETAEVLYGWGRYHGSSDGKVYRSSDSNLVRTYEDFFGALKKSARGPLSVDQALAEME